MACTRCDQEVPTATYRDGNINWVFCADCATVFGFTPREPDGPAAPIVDMGEILEEVPAVKADSVFIVNEGACEPGMPIGSVFGVCAKCAVKHTRNSVVRARRSNKGEAMSDLMQCDRCQHLFNYLEAITRYRGLRPDHDRNTNLFGLRPRMWTYSNRRGRLSG